MATKQPRKFVLFIPFLALMFIYCFSRLLNLLAFPPFIDEYLHIAWAQDVYRGHFLTGAENGRLLALWWMSLFFLSGNSVLWIGRAVTILFSLIGLAAVYSLSRRFAGLAGGILAAVFYILMPFLFFHDRFALSDTYVSVLGVLSLWFSIRFTDRKRPLDAILAGLLVTAAIVAKATGIMVVSFPAIAMLFLISLSHWRIILRGLVLAYSAFITTFGPFYLFLKWRHWDYFGVATTVVGTGSSNGLIQRLITNLQLSWQTDASYLSSALMVLAVLISIYLIIRNQRVGLALFLCTFVPLAAICAFATKLSGRYILFHVPILLLCLSVGLGKLYSDLKQRSGRMLAFSVIAAVPLIWGVLFALPFQAIAERDPASVAISPSDKEEYVTSDASGFEFKEVADYLLNESAKQPIRVIGLISNCGSLQTLELPEHSAVTLECPYLTYTGSEQKNITKLVNQQAEEPGNLWIVSDGLPYATLNGVTANYEKVTTFDRPDNGVRITLYHVR